MTHDGYGPLDEASHDEPPCPFVSLPGEIVTESTTCCACGQRKYQHENAAAIREGEHA